jgi:hypothetical protein
VGMSRRTNKAPASQPQSSHLRVLLATGILHAAADGFDDMEQTDEAGDA